MPTYTPTNEPTDQPTQAPIVTGARSRSDGFYASLPTQELDSLEETYSRTQNV